jgi:hypothetical protein
LGCLTRGLEEIMSDFCTAVFREWELSIIEVTMFGTSLRDLCIATRKGGGKSSLRSPLSLS